MLRAVAVAASLALATVARAPAAAAQTPAPADPAPDASARRTADDAPAFAFGSYGRIGAGTDLRGSTPEAVTIVQHGPRIVESPYAELDLYYRTRAPGDVRVATVVTVAFAGDPFHYTGDFDAQIALRNLYAEAIVRDRTTLWIGSRMYRGDDIYLVDYWPLDDENTVGAGAGYRAGSLAVEAHAGLNRLTDTYQLQTVDVPSNEFGGESIVQLDRQRMMASAKASYRFFGDGVGPSAKVKLFSEIHRLPDGEILREDRTVETLPSDFGYSIGAQVGAWGFAEPGSHANLFARWSQGLTAHDELAVPFGFAPDRRTFPDSSEFVIGWSGNLDLGVAGALVGGYVRRFRDADPADDLDDGWEYVADARPYAPIGDRVHAAVDLSYQQRFPRGISPASARGIEPSVVQIAPMLVYSPFGRGAYTRPHFRLVYRAAHLDRDARDLYALDDPRRTRPWVHYLGAQVEWWFNSTYR